MQNGIIPKLCAAFAAFVIVGVASLLFVSMSGETPGHATPEQAVKAFVDAIWTGDAAAIRRELHAETANRGVYADGLADYLSLVKPLDEALARSTTDWTPATREWIAFPIKEMVNVDYMTRNTFTVHEDTAASGGFLLVKVDGLWKVSTRKSVGDPRDLKDVVTPPWTSSRAVRQTLQEMTSGKYKTTRDVEGRVVDLTIKEMRASTSAR
jgi:hypothetical protein